MTYATDYTLTRGDADLVLAVDYHADPYRPATMTDPAEGAVTVERVELEGALFQLTPQEEAALNQWLAEHHEPEADEWEPEDDYNGDY